MRLRTCRISRLQWLLIATLCANFMVLCYLAFLQDRISKGQEAAKKFQPANSAPANGKVKHVGPLQLTSPALPGGDKDVGVVTIVIREFEVFENNVVDTLQSMNTFIPNIPMVVISDSLPYPPLKLPPTVPHLKLVTLNIEPDSALYQSRPESFIRSKYVIIIPDGVRVKEFSFISYMLDFFSKQDERVRIVAWPIGAHNSLQCQRLSASLKEWKLEYGSSDRHCDSVHGHFVMMMRRRDLFSLSDPYLKPVTESVFIQASLREWKTVIGDKVLFEQGYALYSDPHSAWKHKKAEQLRLKTLYKTFGIKLIKQEDGQERMYGCNKETARCFGTVVDDVPEYIHRDRWTPPCCLDALRKTARHVFRILDSQSVRYWLEGGSLLGAARNGDIIPWDYDVDIGIYREDITRSYHLQNAAGQAFEDDDQFVWTKSEPGEGDFFRVHYSNANHMHVDIFPFYSKNGTMTKNTWMRTHRQDCEFPEKLLLPLQTINFAGGTASVPAKVKEFLELKFGEGVIDNPRYPNGKNPWSVQ